MAENPPTSVVTNNTVMCFSPNKLTNRIIERVSYPVDYNINVNLQDVPNWLDCYFSTTNDYKTFILYVRPYYRNSVDLKAQMLKTCLANRENGEVGQYDVPGESGPPADLYEYINCEWDPGSDSAYPLSETNKFPFLENKIPPEDRNKTYTLFQTVSTNNAPDVDYYLLYPRSKQYEVWVRNESNLDNSIKVSIVQSNEVKKTKIVDKNSSFVLSLSCTNLNEKIDSFVKVEHVDGTITNKQYSLFATNCQYIKEGKKWDESKEGACLSNECKQIVYTFKSLNKEIVFEISSDTDDDSLWNDLNINFYNNNYQEYTVDNKNVFQGTIEENSIISYTNTNNGCFKRFTLNNLTISNDYYCVVSIVDNSSFLPLYIYARISRIKPVFLVHGIDSSPKWEKDPRTSFGDLIKSDQYYDIRPYNCYDYSWDSGEREGILKLYVGDSSGTFGEFINSKRKSNDLKGTVVAHSMGCLLTYYQCKKDNAHFKNNIDNIVFAAPPFFGSATASGVRNLGVIATSIKKTSDINLEILSRGSNYNWERYSNPFLFDDTNITVLVGTKKHDELPLINIPILTFDSIAKLNNLRAITDINVVWDSFTDIGTDLIESTLDNIWSGFFISTYSLNPIKTSEVYCDNRSDGVVGTYSAWLNKQKVYEKAKVLEIEEMHSDVQKFKKGNELFVKEVKNRINNLGE